MVPSPLLSLKLTAWLTAVACFALPSNVTTPNPSGDLDKDTQLSARAANCFPAVGFRTPSYTPGSTQGWWCDPSTEYAFMGFSFPVGKCQSLSQLRREFKDIRETYNGRYIRIYQACDRQGFYDDIITAAWENSLGVHALVWFGFNGDDIWKSRRDSLLNTLQWNPKAKFVVRAVQFGSEPLFDSVLSPSDLASQVRAAKAKLAPLGIKVTVSEMAWGFQSKGGAQNVLDSVDFLDIHMLPFFSHQAGASRDSWPILMKDQDWLTARVGGKKMYWSQNGWPSTSYPGVEPNSPNAVADVANEQAYYQLLESRCSDFKWLGNGGIGWFWHVYSDHQAAGYGLYDWNGRAKFWFRPRTSC